MLFFQRETDCSCHPSTNALKSLLSTPKTRHTISKEQCLPHYSYHISWSSRSPGTALSTSISLPSSSCSSKGCYWITGAQYSFLINGPRCNTFLIRRAWCMGSATHTSDPPCSNQGLQVTSAARKTQEAEPHASANWPTCAMPQQGCYLTSQHSIGPLPAADPFTVGNRVSQKDRHPPTQTYSFLF